MHVESRSQELAPLQGLVGPGQVVVTPVCGELAGDALCECVAGASQ
ncbi:hypothetical protein ACFT9I_01245 [Streptomyces sp. NPDC057137]